MLFGILTILSLALVSASLTSSKASLSSIMASCEKFDEKAEKSVCTYTNSKGEICTYYYNEQSTSEKCVAKPLSQTPVNVQNAIKTASEKGNCQQPLTPESKCRFVENSYGCEYRYSSGKDSAVCYEEPFRNQADMVEYFSFKGLSLGPITEESTIHLADLQDNQDDLNSFKGFVASVKKAGNWSYNQMSIGYTEAKSGISWAGMKGWGVVSGGVKLVLSPVSWIYDFFKSKEA